MVALKFLAGLALLIILVVFSINNMDPQVSIFYYMNRSIGPMPFSFALLGAAVIGAVVAALVTVVEQIRLRMALRKADNRVAKLEEELLEYRRQPVEPLDETVYHQPGGVYDDEPEEAPPNEDYSEDWPDRESDPPSHPGKDEKK